MSRIIKFQIDCSTERLAAHIVGGDTNVRPQVLFLHGAGKATKERSLPIAHALADRGIASLGLDFSGHGESSGQLSDSSLTKRRREAECAIARMQPPIGVVAFSMGGHVALDLLPRHPIASVALFYPAVYGPNAEDLPFDDRFSRAIRQHESWRNARGLTNLDDFSGDILLCTGQNDEVIPDGVTDLIRQHTRHARRFQEHVVPNAPHLLLPTLVQQPELFDQIVRTIAEGVEPPHPQS